VKLADVRGAYQARSAKLSDIARQLAFAGIALVWLFRVQQKGGATVIPSQLRISAVLIGAGLVFDVLQYAAATLIWGVYGRRKELEIQRSATLTSDADFEAPDWLNFPAITCLWAKVASIAVAYGFLVRFLLARLY
jgi:hypothetical protein